MRIIAGEFRSRRLQSLPGSDIRPTPDRMRETLFNILRDEIDGIIFVDAYAGTGAVGIEALSRGARHAVFIEKNREAAALIRTNLKALNAESRARVIHGPAGIYLGGIDADIVFIDPPYPREHEYQAALDALERKPPALAVVQHSKRFELAEEYGPLRRTRIVKQSDNVLSFYRPVTATEEAEQS